MALGTAAAIGAVGAAEAWQRKHELGSMRVWFDPPGLKYVLDADPMEVDRGWVEGAVPPPRREGAPRVVCVGDSVTFGVSVGPRETWCADLRRALGKKVEAFNFGMNGWDAEQVATLLEARVAAWEPDVVVWGAYVNDMFPTYLLYGLQTGDPVFVGSRVPDGARLLPEPLALRLVRTSALFRRLQGAAYARAQRKGLPGAKAEWYGEQLDRIRAWSKNTGVPVVALAIPPHVLARPDTCPRYVTDPSLCTSYLGQYQNMVAALERRGFTWVDGLAAFQASGQPHYHPPGRNDPDHPNADGHAVLATAAFPAVNAVLSGNEPTNPDKNDGSRGPSGVSGSHGSILWHE